MEIERKWKVLLNQSLCIEMIDILFNTDISNIEQYYIYSHNNIQIRCRKITNNNNIKYLKTFKQGFGLERIEHEEIINKERYIKNMKLQKGNIIKKIRRTCKLNDYTIEIDYYLEPYEVNNLIIIEIEFENKYQAEKFNISEIPIILELFKEIKEVTNVKQYSNINIAGGNL